MREGGSHWPGNKRRTAGFGGYGWTPGGEWSPSMRPQAASSWSFAATSCSKAASTVTRPSSTVTNKRGKRAFPLDNPSKTWYSVIRVKGMKGKSLPHPGKERGRFGASPPGRGNAWRPFAAGRQCPAGPPPLPGRASPVPGENQVGPRTYKFALSRKARGVSFS